MMVAGLGISGLSALASCAPAPGQPAATAGGSTGSEAAGRVLTPTFYQWIEDLHPSIPEVNAQFGDVNYQIAPVEGFGIERFVAEAKNRGEHLGRLCGNDPVCRDVCSHRG